MNNKNTNMALLGGRAAAIIAGAVIAQSSISAALAASHDANSSNANATADDSELTTFEEEALEAEEDTMTAGSNATMNNVTESSMPARDNATMNDTGATEEAMPSAAGDTVVLQGTVSSPGEEAGPFQVVDLLPPTLNGNVYVGWLSFTASKPILVAPLHTSGVANETLDSEFGELFVFPGIPNGTMIAPAITMPDYASDEDIDADFPTPETYSATVPFAASGLSVGRLDGEQFIVSYTLYATVHPAQTRDNVDGAITNETQIEGEKATIVSGSAFLNETAYSPNPIQIERGDTVTWVNEDFDPHIVTSGSFMDGDVGDEFDSGHMGPHSSFSFIEDSGQLDYFCELHPNMVGTVQVE